MEKETRSIWSERITHHAIHVRIFLFFDLYIYIPYTTIQLMTMIYHSMTITQKTEHGCPFTPVPIWHQHEHDIGQNHNVRQNTSLTRSSHTKHTQESCRTSHSQSHTVRSHTKSEQSLAARKSQKTMYILRHWGPCNSALFAEAALVERE